MAAPKLIFDERGPTVFARRCKLTRRERSIKAETLWYASETVMDSLANSVWIVETEFYAAWTNWTTHSMVERIEINFQSEPQTCVVMMFSDGVCTEEQVLIKISIDHWLIAD